MDPYLAKTIKIVSSTPTIDAGAYAAGDALSAVIELTGALRGFNSGGYIQSVVITDKAAAAKQLEVCFFSATVTATKNAAFAPTDAQLVNFLGSVTISSFSAFADNGVGQEHNVGIPVPPSSSSTSLFAVIVCREAITPASTSDITLKVGVVQD